MPPDKKRQTSVKHFPVTIAAGEMKQGVSPDNPRRNYLFIQNVGANPATLRFGSKATGAIEEIVIGAAGVADTQIREWPETVPIDSLNFFSAAGTQLVIVEGVATL